MLLCFLTLLISVSIGSTYQLPGELLDRRQLDEHRVTRVGTNLFLNGTRWTASGANVFWLGLDENVIPPAGEPFYAPLGVSYPTKGRISEAMKTLVAMGATSVRAHTLGVSTGNPLSLWPTLGKVNAAAFDTIDWAVYQAGVYGIKLMIPLTDNYDYYHGGKFDFLKWRGFNISRADEKKRDASGNYIVQQFYTNATIIQDFKDYIKLLITHRNKYNNLTYAEDPAIFAYETGNELGGPTFGDMWIPIEWLREIGVFVKQLAPTKLFVDGTYGVNKTHFEVKEVDIFVNHYYPLSITKLRNDIAAVESTGRVYHAGEYEWTGNSGGDSLENWYAAIEAQQKKESTVIAGDYFWSYFGRNLPDCNHWVNHSDGLSLQYGNPLNTPKQNAQISIIRQHFFRMTGQNVSAELPPVACP